MISFDALFNRKSEIEYKGKTLVRHFALREAGEYAIRFRFISANSQFNQAIVLHFCDFVGECYLFDQKEKIPKRRFPQIAFFMDTAPKEIEMKICLQEGAVLICNGSDPLGTKEYCRTLWAGCAMYMEKLDEHTYRCYCNDHEYDDDLDDLIFDMRIEKIG